MDNPVMDPVKENDPQYLYNFIRPTIKSGDLIACKGNSLMDKIIKWWTKSVYSHVGIAWVHAGRIFIIDSTSSNGVSLTPLSMSESFDLVSSGNWTTDEPTWIRAFDQLGKPYSWLDVFRAAFHRLTQSTKSFQCAEYVAFVLGWGRLNTGTPEEIVSMAKSKGAKITPVVTIC